MFSHYKEPWCSIAFGVGCQMCHFRAMASLSFVKGRWPLSLCLPVVWLCEQDQEGLGNTVGGGAVEQPSDQRHRALAAAWLNAPVQRTSRTASFL